MSEITRVGVDLAKQVIQVHGVDATERVVMARGMSRQEFAIWCAQLPAGCVVAMEACSGAHHWARRLTALGLQPRLIAPHFVTPYRMEGKGGKNDATDAAAICEAASRPKMRFVPVKSCAQQGVVCIHRLREAYKEERTACINRIRGLQSEFGLVFAKSPAVLRTHLGETLEDATNELPLRLRTKDVDFDRQVIVVREAKGNKDRVVMLPASIVGELRAQIATARDLWHQGRRAGHGGVEVPHALERKYPKVGQTWGSGKTASPLDAIRSSPG